MIFSVRFKMMLQIILYPIIGYLAGRCKKYPLAQKCRPSTVSWCRIFGKQFTCTSTFNPPYYLAWYHHRRGRWKICTWSFTTPLRICISNASHVWRTNSRTLRETSLSTLDIYLLSPIQNLKFPDFYMFHSCRNALLLLGKKDIFFFRCLAREQHQKNVRLFISIQDTEEIAIKT